MRHYSCDLCGVDLSASAERFTVRVEVAAATAPAGLADADLDADSVSAMADILDELEAAGDFSPAPPARHRAEYDLCPGCRARFVADPLGRDGRRALRFSKN